MSNYKKVWIYGSDFPHKGDEVAGLIHNKTGHFIAFEVYGKEKAYPVYKSYLSYHTGDKKHYFYSSLGRAKEKAAQEW